MYFLYFMNAVYQSHITNYSNSRIKVQGLLVPKPTLRLVSDYYICLGYQEMQKGLTYAHVFRLRTCNSALSQDPCFPRRWMNGSSNCLTRLSQLWPQVQNKFNQGCTYRGSFHVPRTRWTVLFPFPSWEDASVLHAGWMAQVCSVVST